VATCQPNRRATPRRVASFLLRGRSTRCRSAPFTRKEKPPGHARAELRLRLPKIPPWSRSRWASHPNEVSESDNLWHYTDGNALLNIVEQGKLWATQIHYLNDFEELLHLVRMTARSVGDVPKHND
jgi:hypothetical protein